MIQISTSVGCSVNCSYCPQSSHISAYKEVVKGTGPYKMSLDTFKTCIDKVPSEYNICFAGFSEPFLNPQTIDMMEYSIQNNRKVSIYTTLAGVKSIEELDRIMDIFPFSMVVHLPDVEGYMKNPPKGKIYFDIIEKLKEYQIEGYRIKLMCIGTPVPELVEGFNSVDSPPITSRDNKIGEVNGHDFLETVYKDVPNEIMHKNDFKVPVRCWKSRGIYETHILPNGDVYACCNDWKLELKICNLLTDSWEDHTKGRTRIIKKQMAYGGTKCHTCDFARPAMFPKTREQKRKEAEEKRKKE